MPLLDYRDVLYDGLSSKDGQMLQRLQNNALRIILKQDRGTHITDLHSEANVLMLNTVRKHHLCQQTYKGLNGLAPMYVTEKINLLDNTQNRSTRSTGLSCR